MKERIIAALKMWACLMAIIFVPIGLGTLGYILVNEIAAAIVGVSSFLLVAILIVTFTADWIEFENKGR